MNEEDNWEPNEELIEWAKQHFAGIGVGGVWAPDESGVTYIKQDDDTFALVRMVDHPTAHEHHHRFKQLFEGAGLNILEGDGLVTVPPAMTPQANAEQEFTHKQEIAKGWRCECGFPIANFDLEHRVDKFIEDKEVLLSSGDTTNVEVWACSLQCPTCEKEINMDPDDYNLLAGDELFMQWTDSMGGVYIALTRMQMKDMADAGISGVVLGALSPVIGQKVPPWMWGTYNLYRSPEAIEKADEVSDEEE
tara:strand:- start:922 stop:1668 length:747 start_codon:yes stop_codon:yes gene_type:complete